MKINTLEWGRAYTAEWRVLAGIDPSPHLRAVVVKSVSASMGAAQATKDYRRRKAR